MPPVLYPDLIWSAPSARFDRVLRSLRIVAIAGGMGAISGALGALGLYGINSGSAREQIRAGIGIAPAPASIMPVAQAPPQSIATVPPQWIAGIAPPPMTPLPGSLRLTAVPPAALPPGWPALAGTQAFAARTGKSAFARLYDRAGPAGNETDTASSLPPTCIQAAIPLPTRRNAKRGARPAIAALPPLRSHRPDAALHRFPGPLVRGPLVITPPVRSAADLADRPGWHGGYFASDDWPDRGLDGGRLERGGGNSGGGFFAGVGWGD